MSSRSGRWVNGCVDSGGEGVRREVGMVVGREGNQKGRLKEEGAIVRRVGTSGGVGAEWRGIGAEGGGVFRGMSAEELSA